MAATASSPFHEGRALRRARQRRHLTLDDAAKATRIPRRFLEALESDAPVDVFPAPVYARAFERARAAGVEAFAYRCAITAEGIDLAHPVRLGEWAVPILEPSPRRLRRSA